MSHTGKPGYGVVRRALGAAMDWIMRKEVVGRDNMGNTYFRWHEGYGAGRSERREVKWAAEYMFYDPNQIPPEWRLWLRKLREQPPTDEELAQNAVKQAAYHQRVAVVEERERLRRIRQQTVGSSDQYAGHQQQDMARLMQQMQQQQQGAGGDGPGAAAGGEGPSSAQGHSAPGGGPSAGPPPPHPAPPRAEPVGSGDTFKAGVWRPGS